MKVRIRFAQGARIARGTRKNRRMALAMGALLTPAAVMALVLGLWRVAADLKWTSSFAISNGFFSHWQIWVAGAFLLQMCSRLLHRYGSPDTRLPGVADSAPAEPDTRTRAV